MKNIIARRILSWAAIVSHGSIVIGLLSVAVSDFVSKRNSEEIQCLAKNVYFESRGESFMGQVAVAYVTINRTRDKHFPNEICGVVKQAKTHKVKGVYVPIKHKCQFSWFCDGKPDRVADVVTYRKIEWLSVFLYYLQSDKLDPTEGAVFYHNTSVKPTWSDSYVKTIQIGEHIFYRRK